MNGEKGKIEQRTIVGSVISVVSIGVAVLHVAKPELKIDAVALGLIIAALLPWLAPLFKSLKLPGGWELTFQEIQRQAVEARGAAQEAKGAADNAERLAQTALAGATAGAAQREQVALPADARSSPAVHDSYAELSRLIDEYNELRKTPRGDLRTSKMTAVVSEMIALAPNLENFDVAAALRDRNEYGGTRLAAYAYLYQLPDIKYLPLLVESVVEIEKKPFGQYWGLRAIGQVISGRKASKLDLEIIQKLERFLLRDLKSGTDRYYVLSRILRDLREAEHS